jgi:2-keto-4-pentenoate hydratase
MAFEKEMNMLEMAEKTQNPIEPLSDLFPHDLPLDDAHSICEGNIQKRLNAGEKISGYKVGFTNIAIREEIGMPDSTYGYIMDSMVLESGLEVPLDQFIDPKLECEICFKLGEHLSGKNLTIKEALDVTEGATASFEICDARIKDWNCPYPVYFADNGFACRIVIAEKWHPVENLDFLNEKVVLSQNGEKVSEGKGELAFGHPAKAVSWLSGKLKDRNKKLESGQMVMTGNLTPIQSIERGSTYTASFSTLGEVKIKFI